MQGQLRKEPLTCFIESECGHTRRPLHIEIDSDLEYRVREADARPMIYVPLLNFDKLKDNSITDKF
ncbi:MAG: hypothetical protein EHM45_01740 [Desulfobacteraceae bacterium]|nr:MAG: hypothetical protein EHM45_01740 [Desulfobacteraceae bacterium]